MNRKITKFDTKKKEITVEPDMSLTRDEWEAMWDSIKIIEAMASQITTPHVKARIMKEVRNMKEQVQQVIGQME